MQLLRKRSPFTGVKIAKIGKRGFRGQKTPISQCPRNGRFESKKSPFLYRAPQGKWGFLDKTPISGTLGHGSFLTPKPSFPDFGDFDPCRGQTLSQCNCSTTHSEGWGVEGMQCKTLLFQMDEESELVRWLNLFSVLFLPFKFSEGSFSPLLKVGRF